ncbi:MAG: GntR family transcriptional regulator [Alphaproteobacteria bacterium]
MSEEAIARPSLHREVVARVRDMIVEGELLPGTKVPERLLCERFGISRTPLREALKVLASEGLVDLHPNRGATVSALTAESIDEVFPVMGALEALSGELAAARITDTGIAEIRALHYQMAVQHVRGDLATYFRLNQAIHERILEAAGNPTLTALYRSLAGRIRRARYLANVTPERWADAVREHEAILNALAMREGAALGELLRRHLGRTCEAVKAGLRAAEAAD